MGFFPTIFVVGVLLLINQTLNEIRDALRVIADAMRTQ